MYEQHIVTILSSVGERGISVRTLAKHVYNLESTLFEQPDFADVHRQVQQFLLRNRYSKDALVESTGKRGYYRLSHKGTAYARQLMFEF